MKKSLIALAALAAVSAASAQSTVTVSGAMVLAVGTTEIGTTTSDLQIARQTGNIKFAATEDLGGGLKAGFELTSTIGEVATSNLTTTGLTAQRFNQLGSRGQNLTLSGDFGGILVGRADTGIRRQMAIADVTGLSIVSGFSDGSSGASASSAGKIAIAAGDANARIIYGDDFANMVAYTSPSMSGFNIALATVPVQTVSTGVGDDSLTKDTMSYSVNYSNGPLNASVNFTDAQGGSSPYQITTLVANYDLGVARIGLAQQSIRLDSGTNPGNGILVTAQIPMGNGWWGLGYGRRTATASTDANFAGDDVKQITVGYRYNLSKRTHLQAVYNTIDRSASTGTDLKETHIILGHSF